jgi:plasmid stabilization system protein ParE
VTRLEVAPRAETQIRQIAAWWHEHRRAAPSLFSQELADALEALVTNPASGTLYGERRGTRVRRVRLSRSRYHVYSSYDDEGDVVSVRAVWHGSRGSGPPLG